MLLKRVAQAFSYRMMSGKGCFVSDEDTVVDWLLIAASISTCSGQLVERQSRDNAVRIMVTDAIGFAFHDFRSALGPSCS
jgi:hypothetical protein